MSSRFLRQVVTRMYSSSGPQGKPFTELLLTLTNKVMNTNTIYPYSRFLPNLKYKLDSFI